MCYTYDSLNRVIKRQVISLDCDCVVSEENYNYDAAGNITCSPDSCFQYDTNNRLTVFNGQTVEYDMDGNMLSDGYTEYKYDSANRLVKAGDHAYTYNAEDVRIRNLCSDADTTYTYNTNCRLSQLLQKTTNGITTKYVYGLGLIGEEKEGCFKTYHFDYRGSTVAITDINGNITDIFEYDTYGRIISRTGDSFVIFGYNGRDGVITDRNGLYYMRARYYSPEMHRFINADIIHGVITDSTSLNRYSYVNGNPISFVDPLGLSKERGGGTYKIISLNSLLSHNKFMPSPAFIAPFITVPDYVLENPVQIELEPVQESGFLEGLFKAIENLLLKMETQWSSRPSVFLPDVSDYNFEHNSNNDIVGTIINDQNVAGSPVSKMILGSCYLSHNGCEVIAVNNAMVLLGLEPSMADLIKTFESENALIGGSLSLGVLGSNPYSIKRVLKRKDMDYDSVSYDDLSKPGVYIVSYWNDTAYDSMLHTVAIQSNGVGDYTIYNRYGDGKVYTDTFLDFSETYITGYRL